MQYWTYRDVLDILERKAEQKGIHFLKVNPAYTSQTCSLCGHADKKSSRDEEFCCIRCNYSDDEDINVAKNILHLGTYSSQAS